MKRGLANSSFDPGLWLRDVFDRRLAVCMGHIEDFTRFANTVLDSDIGEGKGSVRDRSRRADALLAGAKDEAQYARYQAQTDALRQRALAYDDGDETTLGHARDKLLLSLARVAHAYSALPPEERDAVTTYRLDGAGEVGGGQQPGTRDWLYALPDIDTQIFIDLGV